MCPSRSKGHPTQESGRSRCKPGPTEKDDFTPVRSTHPGSSESRRTTSGGTHSIYSYSSGSQVPIPTTFGNKSGGHPRVSERRKEGSESRRRTKREGRPGSMIGIRLTIKKEDFRDPTVLFRRKGMVVEDVGGETVSRQNGKR